MTFFLELVVRHLIRFLLVVLINILMRTSPPRLYRIEDLLFSALFQI
jgi:hypothetical protein